jgi:chemotaxis protein CheD
MSTTFTPNSTQKTINVAMGGLEFGTSGDTLVTLLGSCVGVVIWCSKTKNAGMAHIVLPETSERVTMLGKYANIAIHELKNELISRGSSPMRLIAKIAGGATMFGEVKPNDVGQRNIEAVTRLLSQEKIPVLGKHLGENYGRIIKFNCATTACEVYVGRTLLVTI